MRRYLEKKAAAKEAEELDDSHGQVDLPTDKRTDRRGELARRPSTRFGRTRDPLDDSTHVKEITDDKTADIRRGFFVKRRNVNETRRAAKRSGSSFEQSTAEDECAFEDRPAFESALHGQTSSNKKMQPRAVAIPYSRLKKERFYDWPPDPTVSRATPIVLHPAVPDQDDSLTASVPDVTMPDNDDDDDNHIESPSNLRRRKSSVASSPGPSDIPEHITFFV